MKLLCDVCENAVASLVCCADEAALCSTCDSRVHAANKLASKHQRVPLLSEPSEPVLCDICQERSSFFFCVEDRALLCRECDVSIHSANALAAKHRRFLLTGIKVGMSSTSSTSQETNSAITLEQHVPEISPSNITATAAKKPSNQAPISVAVNSTNDNSGLSCKRKVTSPLKARKVSTPGAMNVQGGRSYMMNKEGTLSTTSNIDGIDRRKAAMSISSSSTTTISIQRISAGRVPFVAPVLSSLRASLLQVEASNKINNKNSNSTNIDNNNYSNHQSVMMDIDASLQSQSDGVSDYLALGTPGWRFDELLTDLPGVYESGRSLSPSKESSAPGFGLHEEPPWYAELDFLEEHELSPSQEEGVALVPKMPSPPTASGLVTSRGKPTYPTAQSWDFDYLFTGPVPSNEFSVVPDIDRRRSSPISMVSPTRNKINKKRKYWLDD
eukprot:c21067_g1_i2 orf=463-1788(+)